MVELVELVEQQSYALLAERAEILPDGGQRRDEVCGLRRVVEPDDADLVGYLPAALEPGLAALANAMFEANPTLQALSNARLTRLVEVARSAVVAQIGLPRDDPMLAIGLAAVGATLSEYLGLLSRDGASEEAHRAVMAFLCQVISAARSA
ncbi:hypothetical protein FAGKG844_60168 [Frankia sp. AgKG'84/4]|nr:hypothetical protein [Frankia sp. AgKG'84/4]